MLKRALLVLSVAVLAGIAIWLAPGGKAAKAPSPGGRPEAASRAVEGAPAEIAEPGDKIPRSRRHENGEIEKHRAMAQSLEELEKAVKKQERMLEDKRRTLAHVIRRIGVMYPPRSPVYVPESKIPKPTQFALEDTVYQEAMDRKDAQEGARDGVRCADAKREFEEYQDILKATQAKRDAARKSVEESVK